MFDSQSPGRAQALGCRPLFVQPTRGHFACRADAVFCDREDPGFFKTSDFMAWTRGRYYFGVHAMGGEAQLDAFMEAFPY
jgi:hypothetical protein